MTWHKKILFNKDGIGEYLIRTCDICKLSQIKTKDGDWAVYLTFERVERACECMQNGIKEECIHTPEEESA
jgi:hypothetical protein